MKKIFAIVFVMSCSAAMAQIQTPQASPAGSVSTRVGLTDVKIDYFRPRLKGRKNFGEGDGFLTPYGKIWRTGANSGTRISFSDDVKIEGVAVPKGEYLIFTWPGATEWTVSLYKDLTIGGNTADYKDANEQARFKVKSDKLAEKVETFTISIGDISDDNTSAKVQISWENTSVKFTVVTEFDAKVMQAITANTKVNPDNLLSAAHYYYDNKKDLKQALKWTDEYFADGKHNEEFYNLTFKANIQKAMGDKAGALATAQKSLEIAKKAPGDFGYIKIDEDLIKSLK
jgi:Protein of unknown function (DUF2911)